MFASVSSCNDKQLDADDIDGRDAIYNCKPLHLDLRETAPSNAPKCANRECWVGQTCIAQGFRRRHIGM